MEEDREFNEKSASLLGVVGISISSVLNGSTNL